MYSISGVVQFSLLVLFSLSQSGCQESDTSISEASRAGREENDHQKHIYKQVNSHSNSLGAPYSDKDTNQETTVSSQEDTQLAGPCSIQYCPKNTIVNCAGLSLTEINTIWFPRNTTSLYLDNNSLKLILNSSFWQLNELRVLSLSFNKITRLEPGAFNRLVNLEVLNLENNHLSETSYPRGLFDSLSRLTDLRLRYNKLRSNIPQVLFRGLRNLRSLTLDSAGDTFSIGDEFLNLTKLVLSGSVKHLDERSFGNMTDLTQLMIDDLPALSSITDTSLKPLLRLENLIINSIFIGMTRVLGILKPLVGKTLNAIEFNQLSVGKQGSYATLHNNQSTLDLRKTQYLIQICVNEFSLRYSSIFVIEADALSSPMWNKCLRKLDLSGNPLVGANFLLSSLTNLRHIEILKIENGMRPRYSKKSFNVQEKTILPLKNCHQIVWSVNENSHSLENTLASNIEGDSTFSNKYLLDKRLLEMKNNSKQRACSALTSFLDSSRSEFFMVYVSKSLKYLELSQTIHPNSFDKNYMFVGAENVVYIDLRDNLFKHFTGTLLGVDALQTFMLSGNDVSLLSDTFFDGMCNLEELDLSNCQLNVDFISSKSDRVFHNLRLLKRLDLSFNLLLSLTVGTFALNGLLEELDLSKNRFRNIPFNLKDTPNLKMLDMRQNSLPSLEPEEREELDNLANQHDEFKLFISGNVLSCGCDNLKFLNWLATTRVRLDDDRNFTCINNEGQLSYWSVSDDLEVVWRKCSGEMFLSLAVILLFSMGIGFLSVFVIWKNQTFIKSHLLQLVTGFQMNRPGDYHNGVFIGYADVDYKFPCKELLAFIEGELKLKTYVSHRDMDPSWYKANSIVEAINDSWRTILVFSENFLFNDEWSMFTVSSAIYTLSPTNPSRVVALVHENLHHRLPAAVLSAVPEENIVVVSSWEMNYDLRETLRNRLTHF